MRWKATQLIDYAAELNADALLLNGPQYFKSLDNAYLESLKKKADAKGDDAGEGKKKKKKAKKEVVQGTKVLQAKEVGRMLAEVAKEKGITKIAFDRGGYLYHGRVAALAEAAREHGLDF